MLSFGQSLKLHPGTLNVANVYILASVQKYAYPKCIVFFCFVFGFERLVGASQSTALERSSEKLRECWNLNPGLLGKKRKRYLCAMQPPLLCAALQKFARTVFLQYWKDFPICSVYIVDTNLSWFLIDWNIIWCSALWLLKKFAF